jgi:hypothetical protein
VIRRVFWLSVGAAAGITGYRRATAMGRAISVRLTGSEPGAAARAELTPARPALARASTFSATRTVWRTSRAAWRAQRATLARIRSAGLFAHDVREGMDIYLNRQEGQPGPTLADTTRNRRPPARPQ